MIKSETMVVVDDYTAKLPYKLRRMKDTETQE